MVMQYWLAKQGQGGHPIFHILPVLNSQSKENIDHLFEKILTSASKKRG